MSLILSIRTKSLFFSLMLLGCLISHIAYAKDENPDAVSYIELNPQFVINYIGDGSGSKLKYIRTKINVRTTFGNREMIEANLPIIRDAIVMHLSSLTTEQVTGALAREQTRKDTTKAVNDALLAEIITMEEPLVQDILFTSFLTQ